MGRLWLQNQFVSLPLVIKTDSFDFSSTKDLSSKFGFAILIAF